MSTSLFNEKAIRICNELNIDPDTVVSLTLENNVITVEQFGYHNPQVYDIRDSSTAMEIHGAPMPSDA